MLYASKKPAMPTSATALKGRAQAIATAHEHFVLGRPLKGPYRDGLQMAMFGMGCFWGVERKFWSLGPGIWITAAGYAGGLTPNATYEEVCTGATGHNEVVFVVFDPNIIGYAQLLKAFWEGHDPTQVLRQGNDTGTQYRSGVYTYSKAQQADAEASRVDYQPLLTAAAKLRQRFCRHQSFTLPKTTTSNTWPRSRKATAASPERACRAACRRA
jgi:peptide-methionine (S)-S-oxide reductase